MLPMRIAPTVIGIALSLSGLLLLPAKSTAQSFNFVSIDVPCAACPGGISHRTTIGEINPAGEIIGNYTDAVGARHGYLLSGGQLTTINVPSAVQTSPTGINAAGDIVGSYIAPVSSAPRGSSAYCPATGSPACTKGFLYRHGNFSTILFPGHPGAIPAHISEDGSVYGCLHDFDLMGSMFSAAWTRSGDLSLAAGGGLLSDPGMSFPMSMNGGATPGGNVIVGFYNDMTTGHWHGYILRDGTLKTYDIPSSTLTWIWDISPTEEFVGTYNDASGKQHGFVQLPDGSRPITIDYPSAVATIVMGVNPEGVIVGYYTDTKGITHGFLATPVTGSN